MRGDPINQARNKANTGLRKTPAVTISHCFQIGTVPIELALRAAAPPGPVCARAGLLRCLSAVVVSLVQTERAPWLRYTGGIIRASSARTCSGPNQGKPLEPGGHRVGCTDRLIAPTVRKVSVRPNPTATAIIHKAQGGKPSIAHVPHFH